MKKKKIRIDKYGDVWTEPDTDWWLKQANKYDYKKPNEKFIGILKRKGYPTEFIKTRFDDDGNFEIVPPKNKPYLKISDLFKK